MKCIYCGEGVEGTSEGTTVCESCKRAGFEQCCMRCPHCGELWTDEMLDDLGDIGCPSCRRCFDIERLTLITK